MSGRFARLPLQAQFCWISGSVAVVGTAMALVLWGNHLDRTAWLSVGCFFASLASLLWFVQVRLIRPVREISLYAERVSESDLAELHSADLRFPGGDTTSANEIQRMNVALRRLLRSLKLQRERR